MFDIPLPIYFYTKKHLLKTQNKKNTKKEEHGYVKNQEERSGERNAGNAGNAGNVIFRGISSNIPGNIVIAKHSGECC